MRLTKSAVGSTCLVTLVGLSAGDPVCGSIEQTRSSTPSLVPSGRAPRSNRGGTRGSLRNQIQRGLTDASARSAWPRNEEPVRRDGISCLFVATVLGIIVVVLIFGGLIFGIYRVFFVSSREERRLSERQAEVLKTLECPTCHQVGAVRKLAGIDRVRLEFRSSLLSRNTVGVAAGRGTFECLHCGYRW